jgi:hypothetical protein
MYVPISPCTGHTWLYRSDRGRQRFDCENDWNHVFPINFPLKWSNKQQGSITMDCRATRAQQIWLKYHSAIWPGLRDQELQRWIDHCKNFQAISSFGIGIWRSKRAPNLTRLVSLPPSQRLPSLLFFSLIWLIQAH